MVTQAKTLALLFLVASICACQSTSHRVDVPVTRSNTLPQLTSQIQSDIRKQMKDPDSTRFRKTTAYSTTYGDQILCGEYNARNNFGQYSGYRHYYVRIRDGIKRALYIDQPYDQALAKPAGYGCKMAQNGHIRIPREQTLIARPTLRTPK